jgi:Ca-activated chloride channel homolog
MCIRLLFLPLIALLALVAGAAGQDTPPKEEEVLRVETELVEVPVVVTDAAGRPIRNLSRANFSIFEDGKPQDIAVFSTAAAPFEIALLLDTSGSTRTELNLIRRAARIFIDSLRPGDRVALIGFNTGIRDGRKTGVSEIIIPLTNDRNELYAALDRLNTSNSTPYYDAVADIASRIFGDEPEEKFRGRRAMVALTDGVDSSSIERFEEIKELLDDAAISNYFIRVDTRPFFEENLLGDCIGAMRFSVPQIRRYYASFGSGANVEQTTDFCKLGDFERLAISKHLYDIADMEMASLAKMSGGRVFPVADLSEARTAFRLVAEEIGTIYSLGYYPTNEKRDGGYRSIRVEVKNAPKGAQVRAREGYTPRRN